MDEKPSPGAEFYVPTGEEINAAATVGSAALEHWGSIPPAAPVTLNASRDDMDRLLLGLRMLTFSQGDTLEALQLFSLGETDKATVAFRRAASRNYTAVTLVTGFTNAIMGKAQIDG